MDGRRQLSLGWQMCSTPLGECADPTALLSAPRSWIPASAPSTVAGSLRAAGLWSLASAERQFDDEDWWFRLPFSVDEADLRDEAIIGFDGLATIAEVWLNGKSLLSSANMFIAHECSVGKLPGSKNDLMICFRALTSHLKLKRPRPAWRAPMVAHQQLRWVRTTLLGRTPGWSPPAAAVGPWRGVWLSTQRRVRVSGANLSTSLAGDTGRVTIACTIEGHADVAPKLELSLVRGSNRFNTNLSRVGANNFRAELTIPKPDLWWPHTHGEPALYDAHLVLTVPGQTPQTHALGSVGFRTVELDAQDGNFQLSINGVRVFCRGASWMPIDPVTLHSAAGAYEAALKQVREAGMNMLRVSGTAVYEHDDFYSWCDQIGILVWQDFMFANMDYPGQDAEFRASVSAEIRQFLGRIRGRPSVVVLCGNSEVEQQAAMWGAQREHWQPQLFHDTIATLARDECPGVPYWPSSTHGGAFPHESTEGTSSYYGVGAYLRPLEDARRASVRFATECLAFANVPEPATIDKMPGASALRVHHPMWKARTPRDHSAGWDFEDVRDFYFKSLFGIDPLAIRYADHERYLALSRVVSGEIMANAMHEWRRASSTCNGALIWFLRDLWEGAGWGIVAADGLPKSAYYYLRRALQPTAAWITDEGNNGLELHLANESGSALAATLCISLYRNGSDLVEQITRDITLQARVTTALPLASLSDHWRDLSFAYRFGPPSVDLIHIKLADHLGKDVCEHHYLPLGLRSLGFQDIGLTANANPLPGGGAELRLRSNHYAHAVTVEARGYGASDQYFPLAPKSDRIIQLNPLEGAELPPFRCQVRALNSPAIVNVTLR